MFKHVAENDRIVLAQFVEIQTFNISNDQLPTMLPRDFRHLGILFDARNTATEP